VLTLEGGAEDGLPLLLELSLRENRFEEEVWATAHGYNRSIHRGTTTAGEPVGGKMKLTVKLVVESDPLAPGGKADYELDLTRQGDEFLGAHRGAFLDRPVKGAVTGRAAQPLVHLTPGFEALGAGEHPRLVFRRKDLPELRRRMETPEGRAILAMLNTRAPLRDVAQVTDRHTSWMAANWGAIWQLTGRKDAPGKAREILLNEVIGKPLPGDRKDLHHASRLLGIALTYDLCYDAWEEEFRRLMAEYLQVTALDLATGLYEGFVMDETTLDPEPWKHRNAIRLACAGLAAIAVLGDVDAEGKPLPDAERLVRLAERHVLVYLRSGVTQSGCGLESSFYRDYALANGVLQFLQASRTARGRDLSGANPGLLAGQIQSARIEAPNNYDFGLSSISVQASGLWPMGLGSAPREFLPALKWCFDRDAGLAGKQHFGCAYPYQAAYALANYPFEIEAKPPGESLPLLAADPVQGHFLFRDRWQDGEDLLAELYLNLHSRPPLRLKSGDLTTGALNISGLGGVWLRGFVGPSRLNETVGAELLYCQVDGKQAFIGMDLTRSYTVEPRKAPAIRSGGAKRDLTRLPGSHSKLPTVDQVRDFLHPPKPPGAVAVRPAPQPKKAGEKTDGGISLVRHFAVDLSGTCGAPLLLALVDRGEGLAKSWRLPLPSGASVSEPGRFVSGDVGGANLSGWFAAPPDAKFSGGQIAGRDEVFMVLTIQHGKAPAVKLQGAGLGAIVTVGGRTVAFDGRRIVFGK
jgi:hypothetical protein